MTRIDALRSGYFQQKVHANKMLVKFVYQFPDVMFACSAHNWEPHYMTPTKTKNKLTVWSYQMELPPGKHAYKFVLDDGTWTPGGNNQRVYIGGVSIPTRLEADGFGGQNNVLTVVE